MISSSGKQKGMSRALAAAMACGFVFLLLQASCVRDKTSSLDGDKTSSLTLIQPTGHATCYFGDTVTIKWLVSGIAGASIKVRISTDNLRTLYNLDSTGISATDSCRWIIGNEDDRSRLRYPSDSVRIVIVDTSGACSDTLDGCLRVHPLKIIHPAGGETYRLGDTVAVRWRALVLALSSVSVKISSDNGKTLGYLAGRSFSPEDSCVWIVGMESDRSKLAYPSDSVRIIVSGYDPPYYSDTIRQCLRVLNP
jgi:hypothetical protein